MCVNLSLCRMCSEVLCFVVRLRVSCDGQFGALKDGRVVHAFELQSGGGLSVTLLDLGAQVLSVSFGGEVVTMHHDTLEDIVKGEEYFGVTVGRVANRIAEGRFTVGDRSYQLARNNGPNCLHGGVNGWSKVRA